MDINKYFKWVNRSNYELKGAQEEIARLKDDADRAQRYAAKVMYQYYDDIKAAKIEGMKLATDTVINSTCKSGHSICGECATKAVQAEIDKL